MATIPTSWLIKYSIFMFHSILKTEIDYFLNQQWQTDLCNGFSIKYIECPLAARGLWTPDPHVTLWWQLGRQTRDKNTNFQCKNLSKSCNFEDCVIFKSILGRMSFEHWNKSWLRIVQIGGSGSNGVDFFLDLQQPSHTQAACRLH